MLDFSVFDAFIFDWDNTLAATEPLHIKAMAQTLLDLISYHMTYEDCVDFIGTTSAALSKKIFHRLGIDHISPAEVTEYKSELLKKQQISFDLYPGVVEFIQYWHGRKKMAVASNSSREFVNSCVEIAGLSKYFDAVLTADDVEERKPDPELFYKAAAALKCDKEKCLVFEDSDTGLKAAENGKFPVILILNPGNVLPTNLCENIPKLSWQQML